MRGRKNGVEEGVWRREQVLQNQENKQLERQVDLFSRFVNGPPAGLATGDETECGAG
jgi:hypothetical protein